MRRTLRRNLPWGGVPMVPLFRARRPERPEVVVLCDVSDSVRNASRMMLLFTLHAAVAVRARALVRLRLGRGRGDAVLQGRWTWTRPSTWPPRARPCRSAPTPTTAGRWRVRARPPGQHHPAHHGDDHRGRPQQLQPEQRLGAEGPASARPSACCGSAPRTGATGASGTARCSPTRSTATRPWWSTRWTICPHRRPARARLTENPHVRSFFEIRHSAPAARASKPRMTATLRLAAHPLTEQELEG